MNLKVIVYLKTQPIHSCTYTHAYKQAHVNQFFQDSLFTDENRKSFTIPLRKVGRLSE